MTSRTAYTMSHTRRRNSAGTHEVVERDTMRPVYVYHDEGGDGGATATVKSWTTKRLGLEIQGYIGNDANGDKMFRGDETRAGIVVTLSGAKSDTTETDDRGRYGFEELPAGTYTVTAWSSADEYAVVGEALESSAVPASARTTAEADEYPSMEEGEHALPSWSYAGYAPPRHRRDGHEGGPERDAAQLRPAVRRRRVRGRGEEHQLGRLRRRRGHRRLGLGPLRRHDDAGAGLRRRRHRDVRRGRRPRGRVVRGEGGTPTGGFPA